MDPNQSPYDVPPEADEPVVTLTPAESAPLAESPEQPGEDVTSDDSVRWQAKEHIYHHKTPSWYLVFGVVVLGLLAVSILLIRSWTFSILIVVMAAALIVYSARPPRILQYTLGRKGIYVNDHLYGYSEFRGFGVVKDGAEYSLLLLPTKRFRPAVVVYFPEETGEEIVDALAARLPIQEMQLDVFDQVARKLRF